MNKLVTVIGVAAVVTLAGCKDPEYHRAGKSAQNEVKTVASTPAKPAPQPVRVESVKVEPQPAVKHCTCAPGTKHTKPCACDADDCQCVVEAKRIVVKDVPKTAETKPLAPESTTYIVQRGDSLSKISKKFNITIASIKNLNNLKDDKVRIGQKLKLPGKVNVGVQKAPAIQKKGVAPKKVETTYTGATKEYVVKNGDTLGAIAYNNGCNIRQLRNLNGLKSDALKVGQKLKIPAEAKKTTATGGLQIKEAKPDDSAAATKEPKESPEAGSKATKPVETPAQKTTITEPIQEPAVAPEPAAPLTVETAAPETPAPAKAAAATREYVVQEGDDITGLTVSFGISAAAIRELNNLPENAQLTPGQKILLPAEAQQ